jgi:hypothetical protein
VITGRNLVRVTSDPLYSSATSGMLLAMTALQCAHGVAAETALENAHQAWRDHISRRGNDSFEYSDLKALVARLTG